jgi:ubiquinone/menaquinone biosynthesis C-methylase UbiE
MNFNHITELLTDPGIESRMEGGIPDFIPPQSPHIKIGKAYDQASKDYDNYILGENIFLKILKKIALGLDKEAAEVCTKITRDMLSRLKKGIVLDVPAGTGLFTFEEYAKHPNILFVAAEYSRGMLKQAQQKIKKLNAKNIHPVRADVGNLPFKAESFDAVLSLNGIHSFPEKEKAVSEMSRVLKTGGRIHGSLVLRGERWLTDLILETAYYRLLWFTRPALSREEFIRTMEKNRLKMNSFRTLKAAAAFEAVKTIKIT